MARRRRTSLALGQLSLGLLDDPDAIRDLLVTELQGHERLRFLYEMDLCQGSARIDLAAVGDYLEGYEIKSDRDDLRRLPAQAAVYERVFDRLTLVASERHISRAEAQVPEWWGLWVVNADSRRVESVREGSLNPIADPLSRLRLLWRKEAAAALHARLGYPQRSPRRVLWRQLATIASPDEIRELVCQTLRDRTDWRAAG